MGSTGRSWPLERSLLLRMARRSLYICTTSGGP
uniref:Uncharacterized protein n=1 Tax=Arundo donax TaxID=35708 RepID=A0A0A8Y9D0_ARUDO